MTDQPPDPTRHITRSIALVLCSLIFSIAGYYVVDIFIAPDRCTRDVQAITTTCFTHADDENEVACIKASTEMIKACVTKHAPAN